MTIGKDDFLTSSRHTFHQFPTIRLRNFGPLLLCILPELSFVFWLSCPNSGLQIVPHIFNRIEVWITRWPVHDINPIVFKPLCEQVRRVLKKSYEIFCKNQEKKQGMTEFVYFRIGREFGYEKNKSSWDYIFAEAVINAAVIDEAFRHVDKK